MKTQGMSWLMKTGLVLLLTLASTAFMYGGWLSPAAPQAATLATLDSCADCHGYRAPSSFADNATTRDGVTGTFRGSHNKHVIGISMLCSACHVAPATETVTSYKHSNGQIQIAATISGGTYSKATFPISNTYTPGTCSGTSCHANIYGTTPVATSTWGTVAAGCTACHSGAGLIAASGPDTGSHAKHATTNCALCHAGTTNSTTTPTLNHLDGNIDVITGYPANVTKHAAGSYTGTCSTASCHANVYGTGTVTTPVWGVAAGCPSCHTTAIASTGPNTGNHAVHNTVDCSQCHTGATNSTTTPSANHIDGNIDVNSGYPVNVTKHTTASGFAGRTCSTATCHANVYGTGTAVTPAWGTTGNGCSACHATAITTTGPATGSHPKHATTNCSQCHTGAVNSTTVPSANHADGNIDVNSGYPANVTKHTTASGYAGRTCSSASCHVDVYGTGTVTTPVWGATATGCTACHATTIAATGPNTGSHLIHNITTCSTCHASTTNSTVLPSANHIDGNIDVIAGYATNVTKHTTASGYAGRTCASNNCHGAASPVWGANTTNAGCTKCHGVSGTTTAQYTADNKRAAPGYLGGRDTGGATAATDLEVGAHQVHLAGASNYSAPIACAACHSNVNPLNSTFTGHMNGAGTLTFSGLAVANGASPSYTAPNCATTYCHFGKPLNTAYTAGGAVSWTNTALLTGAPSVVECAKCHGFPPSTTGSHNGVAAALNACNACHPNVTTLGTFVDKTLHINGILDGGGSCTGCHDLGGSGAAGTRLAITPQFGAGYSHHYQGAAAVDGKVCYACHWESDANGDATTYHTKAVNAPVDLVIWNTATRPTGTTYTAANGVAYVSGGATASLRTELAKINSHCTGCHSDLNNATQPFSASGDTKTPKQYAWDAQSIGAKYLSTVTTPWGKFSGNFTNTKNTQTKALSAHNNAANNARGWSTLAETLQGTAAVTNFPNTSGGVAILCFDCHNSHGSDLTGIAVTTSYDSVIAKKGGILKQTTAGKGGYTVAYKPGLGGTTAQKNLHNAGAGLCFDCHNNSAVNATTLSGSRTPWGYNATYGASQAIYGYNDSLYFGQTGATFAKNLTYTYTALTGTQGAMNQNRGGHFGKSSAMINTPDAAHQIGGLCTPCHDPHGVSSTISTPANAVPLLKGTFVTSPYKVDVAGTSQLRGGGSKAATRSAWIAGYHIDQNTFQAARAMKPTTVKSSWLFATSAKSLMNLTDTQFAGLCINCHTKATLNSAANAASTNWKQSGRIHNSVAGWASAAGGNVNNKVHAYTCSKCHTPHNSRLPRLLVTNCLDVKHVNRVASGGVVAAFTAAQTGTSGGRGRFPGGGGGAANIGTATNPGPWYFGSTASGSAIPVAATTCHESSTAGGAAGAAPDAVKQQWNTKSLW